MNDSIKYQILYNDYIDERQCEFKDRVYSVRDNGAILRHPKEGHKPIGYDNQWTFGRKDPVTGYMMLSSVRVHQIVATAFHGEAPEPFMVVDHKDTNRCNNRPENLAWVTRMENVMNNPITRRRIELRCGSVEAFLENPAAFRHDLTEPNLSWMCTVTKEQAEKCKLNLERWANEDKAHRGNRLGDWVYKYNENKSLKTWNPNWINYKPHYRSYKEQIMAIEEENIRLYESQTALKESLTENALQKNWKVPSEFLQCPKETSETPLQDYLNNIHKGEVFCQNDIYYSIAYYAELSEDENTLAVITESEYVKGGPGYCLTIIRFEGGKFIHESHGSFYQEIGAMKYLTLALGREWTGKEDIVDDYC